MNLFLDALQAGNLSGTGTYVEALLARLPSNPEIQSAAALTRPNVTAPGWTTLALPQRPRVRSIYRRHLAFGQFLEQLRPDVVHFPANFGTFGTIRTTRTAAVVATLHDLTFFRNPRWFPANRAWVYQTLARRTVAQSDLLIADSACTAADIREYFLVPEERVVVVPLGCNDRRDPPSTEDFSRIRARYGLPERFLLFLGTIEPRKNLPRLIRAWDRIAERNHCDLVIAGREGWKTSDYRKALRNARHRSRIHVTGFVPNDDLPTLTALSAGFVWPSLYEGFGLPPLDAMACGVPVLTSATSSIPEVVGDAAVLVDPEDEGALADGMLRLLNDEKLREALIDAGRRRASELSWARTVEKTVAAYQQAIEVRR